ncbi:MAG: MBL fold metallo-hydrolase [Deltaproteobacteria bacterium]|uniref:MBL fold metallo-hydrolase n=1 Tax=Candidatus Zymogenus saltonus TaxID=2844893 RepID=A0A9D8PSH8_9DELT|nr:MBL fold metallo-hydrolase [Candidatus Zymogenus saltonus]
MEITLIGQSTLMIKTSGVSIMTDPWWGSFEFLRGVPLTVDPEKIDPIDLMLVSHNHVDHWCSRAVELAADREIPVIGSVKAARRARRGGVKNVTSLKPGDSCKFRGLVVHATPATHPFARDAVGFVVEGEECFYFSGDTRYDGEIVKFLEGFDLDCVFLQSAASTYPLVGKDGMELEDAARLVKEVGPKVTVPIHFQVKGKTVDTETLSKWKVTSRLVVPEHGKTVEIFF